MTATFGGSPLTASVFQVGFETRTGRLEIIMSFFHTPSTAVARPEPVLQVGADIAAFVELNADELLWIGRAAGGHTGRAAAATLVDMVQSHPNDIDTIHDLVIVLRDALLEGGKSTDWSNSSGRPDLDAAHRWFGARLDEFAVRLS